MFATMSNLSKTYGVTGPLSLDFPSDCDRRMTQKMTDVFRSFNVTETPTELERRERAVNNLEALFKQWLTEMCIEKDVPESVLEQVGGRVLPFGSYALGAPGKGGDIDALCVGPGFIERHEFFSSFSEKLKSCKEVRDIQVHEQAFVPIINLTFDGIEVDLLYVKVMRKSISDKLNLLDTTLLQEMDPHSIRSLNGYRNTLELLRLVPNVSNFRVALRVIKHWAKCRNIYSNKLGFLGGINFAILVARVCQLYPNASAATLVAKFFKVYSLWKWPIPVSLKVPEHHRMNLTVWDPTVNPSDCLQKMPIISPAYPQMNTAYNVTQSTLRVMVQEIIRGRGITEAIFENKASWRKLFEPDNFFQNYRHYIVLTASAATTAHQQEWASFMETKLRHLVGYLERNAGIFLAHPYVGSFPGTDGRSAKWLIGLTVEQCAENNIDLTQGVENFQQFVFKESRSLYKDGMLVSVDYSTRKSLRRFIPIPKVASSSDSSKKPAPAKKRPRDPEPSPAPKRVRQDLPPPPPPALNSKPSTSHHQATFKRPRDPEPTPAPKKARHDPTPSPAVFRPMAVAKGTFTPRFDRIRFS